MKIPEHLIPILTIIEPTIDWQTMTIHRWAYNRYPSTIEHLPMELLTGREIAVVLSAFPEKANDGNINWELLDEESWDWLLRVRSNFAIHRK